MVDAGEFIDQLLDRLFADGIVEDPFETLLVDLDQCAACGYTKGIIDQRNHIEAKIWDTDRSDGIRLQSLIYGSFFVTWKLKVIKNAANVMAMNSFKLLFRYEASISSVSKYCEITRKPFRESVKEQLLIFHKC